MPAQIAIGAKTVAVLGIKTENQAGQPAYFVPEYLQSVGCKIIPVPGALWAAEDRRAMEGFAIAAAAVCVLLSLLLPPTYLSCSSATAVAALPRPMQCTTQR